MLVKHGADDLRWYIENAEPFPIEGVFQISDRRADLLRLYEHGFERGYVTGWPDARSILYGSPRRVHGRHRNTVKREI